MRFVVRCLLAITAMLLGCTLKRPTAHSPPSDPRIVGSWTIVNGEYPLTKEYRADGTLVQHVGGRSTEPHAYCTEVGYLVVSVAQPDGSVSKVKNRYTIEGDTLTFLDDEGSKRIFKRRQVKLCKRARIGCISEILSASPFGLRY